MQHKAINIEQKTKQTRLLHINKSNLQITNTQFLITIIGSQNNCKIQHSAGKLIIKGNNNKIKINNSWVSCQIEGNKNQIDKQSTQFRMLKEQGQNNILPGRYKIRHFQPQIQRIHFINVDFNRRQHIIQQNNQQQDQLLRIFVRQANIFRRRNRQEIRNVRRQNNRLSMKKYIKSFIQSQYNSSQRECPVCYQDIKKGDIVTSLFCFHIFHYSCIQACFQTSQKCPVCMLNILKHINQGNKKGQLVIKDDKIQSVQQKNNQQSSKNQHQKL